MIIDITDLVSQVKDTWVRWASALVVGVMATTPLTSWLVTFPVVSEVFTFFLSKALTIIADSAEMEAFFLNTSLKKASQAHDYVSARAALKSLPPTATTEDYQNAENLEMAAFRAFVVLT